ncbi:hypothetical protein BDV37DRAFT_165943 [Aspergillus pseudonomiae]|uniref:Uncharacterized protein n=1 Tax=Aspergillus pseudonomiae TaxID=1506151 RepID=A0A5N7D6X3_9EURO|nr:uncharacterized protein BDV37DRAFT_165943 [Aspergillus pseudonomiae]KAE8402114.1 hypothetical protein BDV37DRAFT_165943 [Aspergillus pseudonomiae]
MAIERVRIQTAVPLGHTGFCIADCHCPAPCVWVSCICLVYARSVFVVLGGFGQSNSARLHHDPATHTYIYLPLASRHIYVKPTTEVPRPLKLQKIHGKSQRHKLSHRLTLKYKKGRG